VSEILRDRAKLVGLVVIALLAIVGYLAFGQGGSGGTESPPKAAGTGVVGSRHLAENESAKSLLQSGALAMESLFTSSQSFAGGTGAVAQIEPNIDWVSGGAASAAANQVALTVPSEQSYVLATMSASGTTFTYSRSEALQVARTCGPGCTW
jgi:hypothetical protein